MKLDSNHLNKLGSYGKNWTIFLTTKDVLNRTVTCEDHKPSKDLASQNLHIVYSHKDADHRQYWMVYKTPKKKDSKQMDSKMTSLHQIWIE